MAEPAADPARQNGAEITAINPPASTISALLMADIVVRTSAILTRRFVRRRLLAKEADGAPHEALLARQPRSLSATSEALSRVGTESLPGALLVGGGILAKLLFDRAGTYRRQRTRPADE